MQILQLPFSPEAITHDGFDIDDKGNWLALTRTAERLHLWSAGKPIGVERGISDAMQIDPALAMVRAMGPQALIVTHRIRRRGDINAWIVSVADGAILRSFSVGDGVNDALILSDFIVISYFDEGIYGDTRPAKEGIAIFDHSGAYLWGYQSEIDDAAMIDDCYAICPAGPNRIQFFSYSDFPLVELDVERRIQTKTAVPKWLHGCGAITSLGLTTFLRGPYPSKRAPQEARNGVFALNRMTGKTRPAGLVPGSFVRGLHNGQMLSISEQRVGVVSFGS